MIDEVLGSHTFRNLRQMERSRPALGRAVARTCASSVIPLADARPKGVDPSLS